VAEGVVELALEVGFVAEEAVGGGGVGEEGFVEALGGAVLEVGRGAAVIDALEMAFDLLDAEVGGAGLVAGEATSAPVSEGEFQGEGFFDEADGLEAGHERLAEGFPGLDGFLFQDDGVLGGEAVLDGVHGGAGPALRSLGAAFAGAGRSGTVCDGK